MPTCAKRAFYLHVGEILTLEVLEDGTLTFHSILQILIYINDTINKILQKFVLILHKGNYFFNNIWWVLFTIFVH